MQVISNSNQLRSEVQKAKNNHQRIGFVPTMGFLHQGHLSLVDQAKQQDALVVVSIFVNPLQFNNSEDFEKYPSNLQNDFELLKSRGVDIVYNPSADQIYVPGTSVTVNPGKLANGLEGEFRPGHFLGVATVVSILFNQVQPDFAIFGEKDFQQVRVIESMVRDLSIPVQIIRGELVREKNGLAMSSRNSRLSKQGTEQALALYNILLVCQQNAKSGLKNVSAIIEKALFEVLPKFPEFRLEYLYIVDEQTLTPIEELSPDRMERAVIAGYVEDVRLIDTALVMPAY